MSVSAPPQLMTTEDLLAMPDDGVERWLIRGELRENGMTVRHRFHSGVLSRVGQVLANWLDHQPEPRGRVWGGEAGVRLRRDPDTTVGVDVVCISADVLAQQTDESTMVVGTPALCVEIVSPRDTVEALHEKINDYRAAGVPLIWIVDPYLRTVEIIRAGEGPALVNDRQELTGDPYLPGFRVPVAKLFQ